MRKRHNGRQAPLLGEAPLLCDAPVGRPPISPQSQPASSYQPRSPTSNTSQSKSYYAPPPPNTPVQAENGKPSLASRLRLPNPEQVNKRLNEHKSTKNGRSSTGQSQKHALSGLLGDAPVEKHVKLESGNGSEGRIGLLGNEPNGDGPRPYFRMSPGRELDNLPLEGLAIYEDRHFTSQVGSKIKEAYNEQEESSLDTSGPVDRVSKVVDRSILHAVLLDGHVAYRNTEETVALKKVSIPVLALGSSKIVEKAISLNPGSKVIGLPVELSPKAVECVLDYIHGNHIYLSPELLDSHDMLSKLYIVAEYLQISPLVNRINILQQNPSTTSLDYSNLNKFVKALHPPNTYVHHDFDIDALPSCDVAADSSADQLNTSGTWRENSNTWSEIVHADYYVKYNDYVKKGTPAAPAEETE